MHKLILTLALPIIATAQCGVLVVNPITGLLDCTGTGSTIISNIAASNMSGVSLTSGTACTLVDNLNAVSPYTRVIGAVDNTTGAVVTFSPSSISAWLANSITFTPS